MTSPCCTLARPVTRTGLGLHSGESSTVTLSPWPQGIALFINGQPLRLSPTLVEHTPLRTTLAEGEVKLATPEHLFAALHGLGVFGVKIELSGCPEVPILDGSAQPWVEALDEAGLVPLPKAPAPLVVHQPTRYVAEGRMLLAAPRRQGGLRVECHVTFPSAVIGHQQWAGVITPALFRQAIAPARSFALQADVEAAMAAGLLKGASLASGVLMTREERIANPEGLRFPDEPVRHKVLDFLGDTYLAGRPLQGDFSLTAPGHTANNLLLQQLTIQPGSTVA